MPLLTGHFSDKKTLAMLRSMYGSLEWPVMLHEFAVGVVLVKRYNLYWKNHQACCTPPYFYLSLLPLSIPTAQLESWTMGFIIDIPVCV